MNLPVCRIILGSAERKPSGTCALPHDERFLRRRVLMTTDGERFLVDLAQATSLGHGELLELSDDRLIRVVAAKESLLEVTGPNLSRLAWHIGNRHAPCQIEATRLLIGRDRVLRNMLEKLGAGLREVEERFTPESGAYGHNRMRVHGAGPGQVASETHAN